MLYLVVRSRLPFSEAGLLPIGLNKTEQYKSHKTALTCANFHEISSASKRIRLYWIKYPRNQDSL